MEWLQSFTGSQNGEIVANLEDESIKSNPYGANDNLAPNGKEFKYNLAISDDENHGGSNYKKLAAENYYDPSGSSFLFMQFQITHEPYMTITNKDKVTEFNPKGFNYDNIDDGKINKTNNDTNNFILSMWYTIQKLKRIFIYMKNLPANDTNRPWVKNQYDNTNIYVLSDHGGAIFKNNIYDKINSYLINKGCMTENDRKFIKENVEENGDVLLTKWNSVFMRKPAKYSDSSNLNKKVSEDKFNSFFEKETLITDSDFFPIIEADIQRQIWNASNKDNTSFKFNNEVSWYTNPKTKKIWQLSSKDENVQKMIESEVYANFILDPLNPENKGKMNQRNIPMYRVTWRFFPGAKNYNIQYKYMFKANGESVNIFNKSNYTKVK